MKTLVYNRESNPAIFVGCKNLGQVISWIETEGQKEDLYLAKIELNGRMLDEDEEHLLDNLAVDEIQEIKVELMTINKLVSITMMSIIRLLQDLQFKSVSIAEAQAATQKTDEAGIKEIFAKCKMLIDSLEEVFALHLNKKFKLKHFSLWREAEKELSNILHLVLQAYQMNNSTFLGELLGVAFPDALQQWEDVLEKEIVDNNSLSQIFSLNSHHTQSDNEVDA